MTRRPTRRRVSNGSMHEMSRAVGELEGRVQILVDTVADDQRISGDYRTAMREQIQGLHNSMTPVVDAVHRMEPKIERIDRLAGELAHVRETIKRLEPEVNRYTQFRLETKGRVWALRTMLIGISSIISAALTAVVQYLRGH